jgi:hypothetical protein
LLLDAGFHTSPRVGYSSQSSTSVDPRKLTYRRLPSMKRVLILATALICLMCTFWLANAMMVTRDIAGPRAKLWQVFYRTIHPRYQIAIPHRSFLAEVRFSIVPKAQACGGSTPQCNNTQSKPVCQPGCENLGCNCPACNGPGVAYGCPSSTGGYCTTTVAGGECAGCISDSTSSKCIQ